MAEEFFRAYCLTFFPVVDMDTLDFFFGGLVLLLLAAASPFVYEQAISEPVRVDEAFWAERGFPPLDASSSGEVAPGDGGAEAPGSEAGE